jgi:para-aminobenzoate synthetase component I
MTLGRRTSDDRRSRAILTHPTAPSVRRVATPVDPVSLLAALADRPMAALARHRGMTVVAADPDEVARDEDVWAALDATPAPRLPEEAMAGGWIALLTYDMAGTLERLPGPLPYPGGPPRAVAGRYPTVALIDDDGRCTVSSTAGPREAARLARLAEGTRPPRRRPPAGPRPIGSSLPGDAYLAAVERARELIRAGDCYQVNIVQRLEARWDAGALTLARGLWGAAGPTAHRAYLSLPEGTVVSASPELLVEVDGGRARTAPIKGTAPPGAWEALGASAKDRAEHVMIVDLMRNDLGRCARPGGVRVTDLFGRLPTPYVEHMVSEVVADLDEGVRPVDVLRAVFPGGSVTGCPKVRAMEVIREIEPVARGPAFGSVVTLGAGGRLEASVAIRTAWVTADRAHYWCGGAVTWGSDPARERKEAWDKAAPFLAAVGARAPA